MASLVTCRNECLRYVCCDESNPPVPGLKMETTIMYRVMYIGIIGHILGLYRDNGKENKNYHSWFWVVFFLRSWEEFLVSLALRPKPSTAGPQTQTAYKDTLNPKTLNP